MASTLSENIFGIDIFRSWEAAGEKAWPAREKEDPTWEEEEVGGGGGGKGGGGEEESRAEVGHHHRQGGGGGGDDDDDVPGLHLHS